jgi:hypothetical protein
MTLMCTRGIGYTFYLIMVAQATMNINISFAAMVSFGFAQDWLTAHPERHSFPLTMSGIHSRSP